MRRLLPCLLLLCSCWDFDALQKGGVRPDGEIRDLIGADLVCQGTALREDCTDGVDNDGDCQTDCADSECVGDAVCQPLPGLLGYGELLTGTATTPVECGAGKTPAVAQNLYDVIDSNKKVCSSCSCDAPTKCTSTLEAHAATMDCKDATPLSTALPAAADCTAYPSAAMSFKLQAPRLACQANPAAPIKADPAWKRSGRLCIDSNANRGCTTLACIEALIPRGACIALQGDTACPAGATQKQLWFTQYVDARMCTCICDTPAGACDGETFLSTMADCNGGGANKFDLASNGTCKPRGPFNPMALKYTLKPKPGIMCSSGITLSGSVPTESGPITVCCVP